MSLAFEKAVNREKVSSVQVSCDWCGWSQAFFASPDQSKADLDRAAAAAGMAHHLDNPPCRPFMKQERDP